MRTMLGIEGVSRATPTNRDALPKFCHTVYRRAGENDGTLD